MLPLLSDPPPPTRRRDAVPLHTSAAVLLGFAPAVWAYSLNHVLTRAFYARGDTLTVSASLAISAGGWGSVDEIRLARATMLLEADRPERAAKALRRVAKGGKVQTAPISLVKPRIQRGGSNSRAKARH